MPSIWPERLSPAPITPACASTIAAATAIPGQSPSRTAISCVSAPARDTAGITGAESFSSAACSSRASSAAKYAFGG